MMAVKHPPYRILIATKVSEEIRDALEHAAAQDERTVSDWVRLLFKRELRKLGLLPREKGRKG